MRTFFQLVGALVAIILAACVAAGIWFYGWWPRHGSQWVASRLTEAAGWPIRMNQLVIEKDGTIVVDGLSIGGPTGMFSGLEVRRVEMEPAWATLLSSRIRFHRIQIDQPVLWLRTRWATSDAPQTAKGQGEEMAPPDWRREGLQPSDAAGSRERARERARERKRESRLAFDRIEIRKGVTVLVDGGLKDAPFEWAIADLHGEVESLELPLLDRPIQARLQGVVVANRQATGPVTFQGRLDWPRKDLEAKGSITGVSVIPMYPYYRESIPQGLVDGKLSVWIDAQSRADDLQVTVRGQLSDVALPADVDVVRSAVFGVPQPAFVLLLQEMGGRLSVELAHQTRLSQPHFDWQEALKKSVTRQIKEKFSIRNVDQLLQLSTRAAQKIYGTVEQGGEAVDAADVLKEDVRQLGRDLEDQFKAAIFGPRQKSEE